MRKFLILCFSVLLSMSLLHAVVSEYNFTSTVGTYTPITDGTVLGTPINDSQSFTNLPLGFDFSFDSNIVSAVSVHTDGFLVFGPTAQTSGTAISNANANASNRLVAALNRDLKGKTTIGQMSYKTIGTSPEQVFVVQWSNYQRYGTANVGDTLNFQIRLYQGSNRIEIVYGHTVFASSNPTSNKYQIGLRGNSSAEFNNRSVEIGTQTWETSIAGTVNTATCAMANLVGPPVVYVVPPQGLTYSFLPPVIGDSPQPAVINTPVNNGVDVLIDANLTWSDGGGGPTGYKMYFGTDNPPTNIINGMDLGLVTLYNPVIDLNYSTVYYWEVVPYNLFGDADSCVVWSFTTQADPTISSFPYTQDFEGAYFPPLGWHSSGWSRGTETHTGLSCARSLYNPAGTKILMTPPVIMTADKYISFWWKDDDIAKVVGHDSTYFEISADLGVTWTTLGYLSPAIHDADYHEFSSTLSAYTGQTVNFRWRQVTDGTTSAWGVGVDDIIIATASFNPPTNLLATPGYGVITLNWQAPLRSLSSYKVYRNGTMIGTVPAGTVTYADNTVVDGTMYTYYVTAQYSNPTNESVPSNTVDSTPLIAVFNPVTNLNAELASYNSVALSWTLPVIRSLSSFKVYRNGSIVTTINNSAATSWTDTNVAPGGYLYYVVCVYVNPNGESVASNTDSVTVLPPVYNPPTNLTAQSGNATVVLNWTAPTGSTGTLTNYKVYRRNSLLTTLGPDVVTYTDNTVLNGSTYVYYIKAVYVNPNGESVASNTATGSPHLPVLNPPTNLVVTVTDALLSLTWIAPTPAEGTTLTGYKIYRSNSLVHTITGSDTSWSETMPAGSYTYKVTATYNLGESVPSNEAGATVAINDPATTIVRTELRGCYPNPFNPVTMIAYSVKETGTVSIEIYSQRGQKVRTLLNHVQNPGSYTVQWNGTDDAGRTLGSGMYFYKMKSGNYSSTKKMIMIK